jgi:NAD(P)-dependent dehydrogenase (short-subunit alcohol dehydrogenase family)
LKNEVVVVTGASAGLGRATAREFGRRGACVGLIARGVDGLEGAKREIESAGGKAIVLPLDVADADAIETAAASIEQEFGPIDIWVNNAMASVFSPVREMKPEEYKRVTEVTYLGVVYGTLAALKRMLPRDRGTIVQVGSALAYRSIPLQSAYCAAKHAIAGFTDSLRCELIHDKSSVHITMVQMPALNTPQFGWVKSRLKNKAQPVPPIFQPEVGARTIYWAAHHTRPGRRSKRLSATRSHQVGSIAISAKLALPHNKLVNQKILIDLTICGNRWPGTMALTDRLTVGRTTAVGKCKQAWDEDGLAQVWR